MKIRDIFRIFMSAQECRKNDDMAQNTLEIPSSQGFVQDLWARKFFSISQPVTR